MDPDALVAALRTEGSRLVELDPDALDREVPSCPGWNLADLLVHLGRVQRWATGALGTPPDAEPPPYGRRPAPDDDLLRWLADGLDDLVAALEASDPDEPCWSFVGPATRRFWFRRQPIEATIHRLDADAALGRSPVEIDGELAASGIDEWFEIGAAHWYTPEPDLVGSLHLHATDADGEWFAEVDGAGLRWQRGHLKGDVAVRAPRGVLLALLWGRADPADAEVLGDAGLLQRILHAGAV